jgi:hypothetical protein
MDQGLNNTVSQCFMKTSSENATVVVTTIVVSIAIAMLFFGFLAGSSAAVYRFSQFKTDEEIGRQLRLKYNQMFHSKWSWTKSEKAELATNDSRVDSPATPEERIRVLKKEIMMSFKRVVEEKRRLEDILLGMGIDTEGSSQIASSPSTRV